MLKVFQAGLELGMGHLLQSICLVSLVLQFNLLLQTYQDIFITVDFLFEFLLASLSLFNLQME